MDRSFVAQLNDYRITTAEILYWMPDHTHVLQTFVWQHLDLAPRFPALTKFLDFWERNLDGKLHKVRVANAALIKPPSSSSPRVSTNCTKGTFRGDAVASLHEPDLPLQIGAPLHDSESPAARPVGFRRIEVALHRPVARRPRRRRLRRSLEQDGVLFRRLRRRHLEDRGRWGVLAQRVSDGYHGQCGRSRRHHRRAGSDPNVIYAGTGETDDPASTSPTATACTSSSDAGRSWTLSGTERTPSSRGPHRACTRTDPGPRLRGGAGRRVRVEQGARRLSAPSDGGNSWHQDPVSQGPDAGAVKTCRWTRNNPRILFAAVLARPSAASGTSGQRRPRQRPVPLDGRWRHLAGAVSSKQRPARAACWANMACRRVGGPKAGRVFALVEAEGEKTGLYRSDDYGAHWTARPAATGT